MIDVPTRRGNTIGSGFFRPSAQRSRSEGFMLNLFLWDKDKWKPFETTYDDNIGGRCSYWPADESV